MAGKVVTVMEDGSGELSSFTYRIETPTAGTLATLEANITALYNAVDAITLGAKRREDLYLVDDPLPLSAPNPQAHREIAIVGVYQSTVTGKQHTFSMPCPVTANLIPGTDQLNMGDADVSAFKFDFDNLVVDPHDGTAVQLVGGRLVGKNI